jgi:hypothetical protein
LFYFYSCFLPFGHDVYIVAAPGKYYIILFHWLCFALNFHFALNFIFQRYAAFDLICYFGFSYFLSNNTRKGGHICICWCDFLCFNISLLNFWFVLVYDLSDVKNLLTVALRNDYKIEMFNPSGKPSSKAESRLKTIVQTRCQSV